MSEIDPPRPYSPADRLTLLEHLSGITQMARRIEALYDVVTRHLEEHSADVARLEAKMKEWKP